MYEINMSKTTEYKTENGLMAVVERGVYRDSGNPLFYTGYVVDAQGCKIPTSWTTGGVAVGFSPENSKHDIVGVKKKTMEVDWPKYPDCIKAIALDEYGDLVCATSSMERFLGDWERKEKEILGASWRVSRHEHPELIPSFDGDWRDSYVERPGFEIPWDRINEKYDVVAMDGDGDWCAYTRIPNRDDSVFGGDLTPSYYEFLKKLSVNLPPFPGDWRNSIHIRPGSNPPKDFEKDEEEDEKVDF